MMMLFTSNTMRVQTDLMSLKRQQNSQQLNILFIYAITL